MTGRRIDLELPKTRALPRPEYILIDREYRDLETGVRYLYVSLEAGNDWPDWKRHPDVVEYEGRLFAKSCYDSDRHHGIYWDNNIRVARRSTARLARPRKGAA